MSGYKDKTWCPPEIHEKCINKPTCDRVMTREQEKESKGDLIWWFVGKLTCFKAKPKDNK